jgi:hypothetical protein
MGNAEEEKSVARVRRLLARGSAKVSPTGASGRIMLTVGEASLVVERALVSRLAREGTLVAKDGCVALARPGGGSSTAPQVQGGTNSDGQTGRVRMETAQGWEEVTVNLHESPLAQLARFRLRDGSPFVSTAEVEAGERLRLDYTRGRIMQRLGANWEAGVSTGRRSGDGIADLTVSALAARQRVDHALSAVGPELAGVLVDVCCFLKGLELVERERGWPVRSAKVVLKTALGALSRHYSPPSTRRTRPYDLYWGSEDYRPELR